MPETSRSDCRRCSCPNNIDDMVQCEGGCNGLFHYGCVGFDDGRKQENWMCSDCIIGKRINNPTVINSSAATLTSVSNPPISNACPTTSNISTTSSNANPTSSNANADRMKLQLELLEEQQAYMLREFDLQQMQEYDRKKMQLEKEAFRVRCDILRASGLADINQAGPSGTEPVGDWMNRLAQATGIGNPPNVPSSTTTGIQVTNEATSNPISMAPTSTYLRDFLPGGGRSQPGFSTPITSSVPALWTDPATSFTTFTQSLPPTISSVRQQGQHPLPMVNGTVSQCNQLPSSTYQLPLGLGPSQFSQYPSFSAGPSYPYLSQINVNNPYLPVSFPQYIPNPRQLPTVSQSVPAVNHIDLNMPTPRQLAARQVMSTELPSFSGSPEEWPMFYSAFHTSTEACGYSDVENLGRLQRCLKGSALEAVRSRLLLPAAVPQVIQTLQLLYGRPEQIIYALLAKVREVPAPKADNLQMLVTFGMAVQNFCDHLLAAGQMAHLSNPILLQELVDKLPAHLKLNWAMYKRQFIAVDLRVFGGFMANIVSAAADVTLTLEAGGSKAAREEKAKGFINAHSTAESDSELEEEQPELEEAQPVLEESDSELDEAQPELEEAQPGRLLARCLVCSDPDHRVKECQQFQRMSGEDKWQVVQEHQLCRLCLGKHGRRPCRFEVVCEVQGCQMRHHPLLHSASTVSMSSRCGAIFAPNQFEGVNAHRAGQGTTLFRILPVTLFANGKRVDTFAFIDEGSSVTLVEKWIADKLNIKGVKKRLCLSWTGNVTREEENSFQVKMEISGSGSSRRYALDNVRTVSSLALPRQSLRYSELAKKYQHLQNLPVKDYDCEVPGILIGAGHTLLTATKKLREGRMGEPIAAETRLGWAVYGSLENGDQNRTYNLHISERQVDASPPESITMENIEVSTDCGPEADEAKQRRWKANPVTGKSVRRQSVEYPPQRCMSETTQEKLNALETREIWLQDTKKLRRTRSMTEATAKTTLQQQLISQVKTVHKQGGLFNRIWLSILPGGLRRVGAVDSCSLFGNAGQSESAHQHYGSGYVGDSM